MEFWCLPKLKGDIRWEKRSPQLTSFEHHPDFAQNLFNNENSEEKTKDDLVLVKHLFGNDDIQWPLDLIVQVEVVEQSRVQQTERTR